MFLIHEVNTVLKDGKALTIIQVGVLEIGYALLCYVCPEQPLAYKFDNILTCMHVFRPGNLLLTEQISVASRVRNDTKLHLPPLKAMSYLHYSPSLHHKNLWWCTTIHAYLYHTRQMFQGRKLLWLCRKHTIRWKAFVVHQVKAIMYCTQLGIQGQKLLRLAKKL